MRTDPAGKPLKPLFTKAFEYSDGWVIDARLVALNARDAADRGATIRPAPRWSRPARWLEHWRVTVEDSATGQREDVKARLLVNAAGPWVDRVLSEALSAQEDAQCPAGAGQPHRGAQEVRRSARLFLPEQATAASSSPFPMRTTSR
jgi:glycerol-3-phosphate dehydrogenase